MDALTYICLGFFLVLALLGSGFWFYFKKLNPKLQAKYEGLVAAAVAKSEAALQSLNLDPPTVEELDWLGLLLNRFWTSMRESDSLLTPLHDKLKAGLEKGLAKLPAPARAHVGPVTFKLLPGPALPTLTKAEVFDRANANIRLHFGTSIPSPTPSPQSPARAQSPAHGQAQTQAAPAQPLLTVEIATSVSLPFSRVHSKLSDVLIPLVCKAKLTGFGGVVCFTHSPMPSHAMYITFAQIPKLTWELSLKCGYTRLEKVVLDTFRLRAILYNIIALKIHKKLVYPNIISKRIPLAPEELSE